MCGGGFVAALLPRMVIAEFAQDDRAHGSAFGGRTQLPIETEALTADATANVLPELRPSEQNLHCRRPNRAFTRALWTFQTPSA
jgi:hypothetical protein